MQTVTDTLTAERVVAFIDYHNTREALRRAGHQIDLLALRDYIAEGRHLIETFVYFVTDPLVADDEALARLQEHGFLIQSKRGHHRDDGQLVGNFDLDIALDIQDFNTRARPDIVVLVVGNANLTPLIHRLRRRGIRVEIASTPGDAARRMRIAANGFIDLTQIGQGVDNLPLPPDLPGEQPYAAILDYDDEDDLDDLAQAPLRQPVPAGAPA